MRIELIVVGTSLGGLNALTTVLSRLPARLPVPVAIVQHRGTGFDATLATLLGSASRMPVLEAEDKMALEKGQVYLAPADYHLLIEGRALLSLSTDPPVRFARPSIDVLFESAGSVFGGGVVGVVLTGASADGAEGLRTISARGGVAVVEDPRTAESSTMPAAALAAAPAAAVLPLQRIPDYLVALADGRHA